MQTEFPPAVSVAIPVYNGEAYLAQAIESVLAQSFTEFELIVCDNASSDRTMEIAQSYADPRIRILQNPLNIGFGPNWNRCLREARGRYIKILPHDDLLHPRCLEEQAGILDGDEDSTIALVFSARRIIGPSGRSIMTRGALGQGARFSGAAMARQTARKGTNPIGEPGAVLFRSSAARAAGPFNEARSFVIDIDYWLRLLKHGDALYMPETLASFRVSPSSHSVRMLRRQASEFTAFLRDISHSGLYRLSGTDIAIGTAAALANSIGRALFYRFAIGDA